APTADPGTAEWYFSRRPGVEPKPKPQPAPAAPAPAPTTSAATSAPSAPVEITCREERLDITTEWHALGTAKLRKYVTSEQVERRIPLVRERVRVERIPVSEAERSTLTDKEIAEAVEEVTLREEHPIIRKYVAPVERVRLIVERYTTEEVVRDELRREHVEVHDSTTAAPDPTTPATNGVRPDSLRPFS
ncbi:YsnF/AvaK domain-containing protein, partial [Kitasatospora sp. NPDC058190]|uniref:YsnF/AvaK domain-containing protein n=1 Tax=Kitasatospora sp. NPDC058190 TaxID=3346371 RepID=UPI0036DBDA9A